jgi:nitrile hydratase beta subunit
MAEWAHDLGGAKGFGPVEVEREEPVFHAEWERRAFGITGTFMASGAANTSEFRHAIERMDPDWYLDSTYYEHWLTGLATLLVEKGVVSPEDLERTGVESFPLARPAAPDAASVDPAAAGTEPFELGQAIRVREFDAPGHTRCPAYVRGRTGVVVRRDGSYSVPDVEAHTDARPEEPTYSVRFDASELWGDEAEPGATVCVDLWHRYLEPIP